MKKKTKYMDFYYKCLAIGIMPKYGLCENFKHDKLFKRFDDDQGLWYWGYDGTDELVYSLELSVRTKTFTPLRQTIVLLMAAMAGEL